MVDFGFLLSVAVLWSLVAISPGPNFAMTVQLSLTRSRWDGILAAGGIGLGTMMWGAAACFGIQALFILAPWLHQMLKLSGASYLIFIGIGLIWGSRHKPQQGPGQNDGEGPKASAFWLGLATAVAHPGTAAWVASIFATTLPENPSTALSLAVIATMVAISLAWYSAVACLFTLRPLAATYQRCRRWIDGLTGGIFILFGLKLAVGR